MDLEIGTLYCCIDYYTCVYMRDTYSNMSAGFGVKEVHVNIKFVDCIKAVI